jgi:alpha-L-fucosidase 2
LDPNDRKLLVAKDYPLPGSHRHFSHLMAIHPLGLIRWENGPRDRAIIEASLADLEKHGSSWWTGYSFSWLASLAARARDGEKAERALEIFSTAFCLRNSFHCNGDQTDKGYSNFRYRPFTLEGNFAAAAGLQEMLLQSYSGTIRVFGAIPDTWRDVSFDKLRAEGAFVVSAERRAGRVTFVEIRAEAGGTCRLENPFGEATYNVKGLDKGRVRTVGTDLVFELAAGQTIRLTREPQ